MTRPKKGTARRIPSYLTDNTRGRAYCWVYEPGASKRRKVTLGAADSPESHRRFAEVMERFKKGQPVIHERGYSLDPDPEGSDTGSCRSPGQGERSGLCLWRGSRQVAGARSY